MENTGSSVAATEVGDAVGGAGGAEIAGGDGGLGGNGGGAPKHSSAIAGGSRMATVASSWFMR